MLLADTCRDGVVKPTDCWLTALGDQDAIAV
jgi:hypothetical protein